MNNSCIFCRIIEKELPAKIIAETQDLLVIQDISPKAPVHYLIIPKKHIQDLNSLQQEDHALMGDFMLMAQQLGNALAEPKSFTFIINNGAAAGQSVFHLHAHFLSGKRLTNL